MVDINKYIKKFKIFFVWQHEEEEKWLREMSLRGYELVDARLFIFTFRVCEPKDVVYKLDYRRLSRYEEDNYLTIFAESDWEYVTGCMNWFYFKNENYNEDNMEIFNDEESKAEMVSRVQKLIGLITVSELCMLASIIRSAKESPALATFWALLMMLLTYGNIKMFLKHRALRKRF
ncbi:DUF2812 domain-containing protein [Clostridium sp. YIM B02505]|uniref:DUF2812 domain-containing protein n=1 Tax=Clostridium yunnanense TaxID=2800325 RepID=A0ABS1EQY1_9CLOT|nr:DUF2812 domain-containing protein [Clostridium yunnanense]MBK1811766.1 DUF2812 domain-containing protein [Clostridium yunnanense]